MYRNGNHITKFSETLFPFKSIISKFQQILPISWNINLTKVKCINVFHEKVKNISCFDAFTASRIIKSYSFISMQNNYTSNVIQEK